MQTVTFTFQERQCRTRVRSGESVRDAIMRSIARRIGCDVVVGDGPVRDTYRAQWFDSASDVYMEAVVQT